MNEEKLSQFFRFLAWKWFNLSLFFLPLVLFWPLTNSTSLPKYVWLTFSANLLFFFIFAFFLTSHRLNFASHSFLLLISSLLIWSFLICLTSLNPFISFFGNRERFEGWFAFSSYLVFALGVLALKPKTQEILETLEVISFSAALVSLIALFQIAGYGIGRFSLDPQRASSTLGNPDFLGSYLLLTFPLTLSLFFLKRISQDDWQSLIITTTSLALQLSALYLSFSRAAWAGFFLSLALFFYLFLKKQKLKVFNNFFLPLLLVLFLTFSLSFFAFRFYKRSQTSLAIKLTGAEVGNELANLKNFIPPEAQQRLISAPQAFQERMGLWKAAVKFLAAYPFLGSGLDTYHLSARYFEKSLARADSKLKIADRPHNDFLQQATSLGIPGFFLYLCLLIYSFLKALKLIEKNRFSTMSAIAIGLLSALVGYAFQIQFVFHVLPTAPFFFAYLALIGSLTIEGKREVFSSLLKIPKSLSWLFLVALSLGLIFLTYKLSFIPFLSQIYIEKSIANANAQQYYQAIDYAEKATELMPGSSNYYLVLGEAYRQLGITTKEPGTLDTSLYYFKKAVETEPYSFFNNLKLAVVLLQVAEITKTRSYFSEAINYFQRVLEFNPDYFEAYYNIGVSYYYQGKFDQAKAYFQKTLKLNPQEKDACFLLGRIAEAEKEFSKAKLYYQKSLKIWEKEKKEDPSKIWKLESQVKKALKRLSE